MAEFNDTTDCPTCLDKFNLISLLAVIFPSLRKLRDVVEEICIDGYKIYRLIANTQGQPPVASWVFCSEFVAIVYKKLGLLSKPIDVRNVAPVDFICMRNDNGLLIEAPIPI